MTEPMSEMAQTIGALREELAKMTKERDYWAGEEARVLKLLGAAVDDVDSLRGKVRWLEQVVLELAARSVGVDHG